MARGTEDRIRLRLDIAYDGTAFHGWSRQRGLRTVQGELEAALATALRGEPVPALTVAGRTDAGVHASGQVAHLDVSPEQLRAVRRRGGFAALARRLSVLASRTGDVVVTGASEAPPGFDARFSAIWRRYEYRIADARAPRIPVLRHHTLWHPGDLDEALMARGAELLAGLHDWAAFCKPREGATTIRTLQGFRWEREADGVLVARLQADAFCHSMVRALVGASVAVGEGRLSIERMLELRDELSRTSEFRVVAARGLTLTEVGYPDDSELASRATQTRARRQSLSPFSG